jgi:hypothetical protein
MANMRWGSLIRGVIREDIPEYPEVALREAMVNALAHRHYSHFVRGSHIWRSPGQGRSSFSTLSASRRTWPATVIELQLAWTIGCSDQKPD